MIARTRLKLRNVEKSISFMQEQHAKTLEGLHQEMDKLQKKNARLIFQLIMNEGTSTGTGHLQLEDDLIASRSELSKVQSYLTKEKEEVSLLNHRVDDLLSKHTEDITVRDNLIKRLHVELDSKANAIVVLTQQIRHARTRLKQELESRSTKAFICSCPHCCIHSKILESKEQQRALCLREKKLRKVDHHHHNALHDADASTPPAVSAIQTRHFHPTPPLSPPPSSTTTWWHGIVKRASTPVGRNSLSTGAHISLPCNQMGVMQNDHAHSIHLTTRHRMQSQSVWDRGDSIGRERTSSQAELEQVLRLKCSEGENRVAHTKLVSLDNPAILPPINPPPLSKADYLQRQDPQNSSSRSCVFSRALCQDQTAVDSSVLGQHRTVTYKSPALSNALPSSLCVLHRTSRCQAQTVGCVMSKEALGNHKPEGVLLVKESGKDLSSATSSWAKGTPALD